MTFQEIERLAKAAYASGYFPDLKNVDQAIIKIEWGAEMGFPPVESLTGINVIQGKITMSANLMAAAIKRKSNPYDYRIVTHTNEECVLSFLENGQEIGRSSFTVADAKSAGLAGKDIWRKFGRNLLFARAISNGFRWYCPDLSGSAVYTPEELGAEVNGETGDVVRLPEGHPGDEPSDTPQPAPEMDLESAERAALKFNIAADLKALDIPLDLFKTRVLNGKALSELPIVENRSVSFELKELRKLFEDGHIGTGDILMWLDREPNDGEGNILSSLVQNLGTETIPEPNGTRSHQETMIMLLVQNKKILAEEYDILLNDIKEGAATIKDLNDDELALLKERLEEMPAFSTMQAADMVPEGGFTKDLTPKKAKK